MWAIRCGMFSAPSPLMWQFYPVAGTRLVISFYRIGRADKRRLSGLVPDYASIA